MVLAMDAAETALQRAIFRDRTASGRCTAPGDKLVAGARLFDTVRRRMLAGIRSRHPEWDAVRVEAEFRRQMEIVRRLDDGGVYTPCGTV